MSFLQRPAARMLLLACWMPLPLISPAVRAQQGNRLLPPAYKVWSSRGVDVSVLARHDQIALLKGGVDPGHTDVTNLDVVLTVDTEESLLWENGQFLAYAFANNGGHPAERVGDLQYTSNIDVGRTSKLNELWYQHRLPELHSSVLVGLHDLSREFYVLNYGLLFLNTSLGIGPELSLNAPSVYPISSLGLRYAYEGSDGHYLRVGLYDGAPGRPDDYMATSVHLGHGDGVFGIAEAGLEYGGEHPGKWGVGYWHHTVEFEDFAGAVQDDNQGAYLIAERELLALRSGGNLGGFVQLGLAQESRNEVDQYVGFGLNATGLVPRRPDDVIGIGVAHAHSSQQFRAITPDMVPAETAIELTYLFSPLPWLLVQPDLQYVVNPGASVLTEDAIVANLRLTLSF